MDITIYNKNWVVPAKCGSRYLDEAFGVSGQFNIQFQSINWDFQLTEWRTNVMECEHTKMALQSDTIIQSWILPLTHMVIREPISHLESALHTDLWGHITDECREIGLSKDNGYLTEVLLKYTTGGTGHWSPHLYLNLYALLRKRPDIQIVSLTELTPLLESMGLKSEYVPSNYNFEKIPGPSRSEIVDWVRDTHPTIWKRISELHMRDIGWYNRIVEGIEKTELKKVLDLSYTYRMELESFKKWNLPKLADIKPKHWMVGDLPTIKKIKRKLI